MFGLFGFGATELFRRSFSAVFFDEAAAGPNEFLLLVAGMSWTFDIAILQLYSVISHLSAYVLPKLAGLATLLTCAAGAPFEILRVRSMSQLQDQGVKDVFDNFVVSLLI